jgi:SAM-dependent methyltransferase
VLVERVRRWLFGLEDRLFDLRHRIDTRGVVAPAAADAHEQVARHATSYQAVWTRNLRVLVREAGKLAQPALFVDIGSGKGKACIYAARRFARVIGVEYAAELVAEARRNQQRAGRANIEFVQADAAVYDLPDETALVFLFNPFDAVILGRFLERNRDRIKARRSVVAYANDMQRQVLAGAGFECLYRDPVRSISLWR